VGAGGPYRLITRAKWGARPPVRVDKLPPAAVMALAVHYSASNADEQAEHANCAGRVRAIQRFHMETRGWNDVAYNHLVCKHGYTFQGRGIGVRSAATGPANGFTYAVCFLGDDTPGRDDVTNAGRVAIAHLLAFVRERTGRFVPAKGHRDYMATSCPGNQLYAWLRVLSGPPDSVSPE
jgi:hypothetical protein